MTEDTKWEYRVHKYSNWRGMKPEELNETLNEWGMDGWEVISTTGTADGSIWVTAKKPLSLRRRRERSIPS